MYASKYPRDSFTYMMWENIINSLDLWSPTKSIMMSEKVLQVLPPPTSGWRTGIGNKVESTIRPRILEPKLNLLSFFSLVSCRNAILNVEWVEIGKNESKEKAEGRT